MIESPPIVRIELSGRPEGLTLIRSVVAGVAELLSLDDELIVDLKMAVSEAAGNAVIHAYSGAPGPLLVELRTRERDVEITVRDYGTGIQAAASNSRERMGVGLAVITALADRAEFLTLPDGGTEVRMSFVNRVPEGTPVMAVLGTEAADPLLPSRVESELVITVAPVSLLGAVLGRACRALAARAHFAVARFSEIQWLADALGSFASAHACGSSIAFSVAAQSRRLDLAIGPLASSVAESPPDLQADPMLTRLVEELTAVPGEDSVTLHLVVADRRPSAV